MKTPENPFPVYDRMVLSGSLQRLTPAPAFISATDAFRAIPRGGHLENLGPATPPFDSMWIEGVDRTQDGQPIEIAGHIESNVRAVRLDNQASVFGYQVSVFATWGGRTYRAPVGGTYELGDDGTLGQYWHTVRPEHASWAADASARDRETGVSRANRVTGLAIFTISLMHCRNIKQEQVFYRPQPRRKGARQRPTIEYHKIHLPAPSASASGSRELTGTTKLHMARGHFKTYTEDAPLLGKHTGTYYWGWQARGNRKNGEIVSSYKVGSAA